MFGEVAVLVPMMSVVSIFCAICMGCVILHLLLLAAGFGVSYREET